MMRNDPFAALESRPPPTVHAPAGEFPLPHGQPLPCRDCHWDRKRSRPDFTLTASCNAAGACHDGDHEPTLGATCTVCHPPATWDASRFDHDLPFPAGGTSPVASYPLRGKHAQVRCERCHDQRLAFTLSPTTCVGCHRDDDGHRGSRGDDCALCHTEAGWR